MTNNIDKKTAVELARIRHLYSASKSALIASTILASILAFIQREVIASSVVIVWFSLIVIVTLVRATFIIKFQRSKVIEYSAIRVQLVQFRFSVLLAGVVWGSAGLLMFPLGDQQHQMFLIFMLAGLSAGGMIAFSADLVSAIVYTVSVLVPLIFSLFIENGSLSLAMGTAGILYLSFIIMNSRQINLSLLKNIVLSLEAADIGREARLHADNLNLNNHILSQINQHTALSIILEELALHVEALHPDMICSILLVGNNGKTLHTGAAPSLPNFYNQAIDGLEIGDNVGSCGTAAFRGERVIVEDIEQHPYWTPFRSLASRAGLRSCWSQPFKDKNGKVLGTLAIYHRKKTHPTENELKLVTSYANLVQLAIVSNRAQSDLRISAIAFESQDGMLVTDANKTILRANRAFTKISGYTEEEVIGQTLGMHIPERRDVNLYTSIWDDIEDADVSKGEVNNYRKNGEVYPEQLAIVRVKDPNGITTNYVASLTDISISKAAAEEIQSLAFYDPLTNLPNRRLMLDRLTHALATSIRSGKDVALLYIDIDNFKKLNDSLGHAIGDLLLQQVAERLATCVREGDTVARLGGDEYLVLLENLSEQAIEAATQAETISEKILSVLEQPYQLDTNVYQSTVSIGVALSSNHDQLQDELLKHADIAMYQAKKAGRNVMCFYDPQMQHTIQARAELERELREAIEKQQFQLYYQIQVDHHGHLLGAEALIRWLHPERGLVSPFHFIPLAEETGLILPIGRWVLETACAQLKAWQLNKLTCDLTLSINVSAKQFHQVDFVEQVQNTIHQYAINPKLLKLELTESILLESIDDTIVIMNALKKVGIRFALDDFGTGYSSLQYLKRLPLTQLKIDQSFVRDIVVDSNDEAIVQTIIAMAQSLGMEVIAEGVEAEEQRQLLFNKGCRKFQGYLFGKPVPVEQFEAEMKQNPSRSEDVVHFGQQLRLLAN